MRDGQEEWRPVVGAEGLYEVSDRGRVRSVDRVIYKRTRWGELSAFNLRGQLLKSRDNGRGYSVVEPRMGAPEERTPRLVHRLVAEAFLPKVPGKDHVNHKNGDKADNEVGNLEWCDRSENMLHAHATGLASSPKMGVVGTHVQSKKEVYFESQMAAEIALSGRKSSAVHHCLIGKKKSAYGYRWRAV